ncbi:BRCT domain-containing protein [Aeromonas caviae]|uniref:BRCT domain-containing protein n=1 Tax=Aeromonas caviae TaxID=648 RepID=UPI0029D55D12|nr:BRCT domain-containing protein [Aeromonas caviae]MDX7787032.1 BRCT domain-containing protein [Aeromonas caviae]
MEHKYIIYVNSKGEVKPYELADVSENDMYVQAIHDGKLKTFRQDRIVFEGNDYLSLEQEITSLLETGCIEVQEPNIKPSLEVCFTGFGKIEKESLTHFAESLRCLVRKSVTTDLDVLCYGENAGPTKMRDARNKGILILNKEEFCILLKTGEIPL